VQKVRRLAMVLSALAVAGGVSAGFMVEAATSSAASSTSIFGKKDPATKSSVTFAMIDLVGGPVAFPQAEQGAQAAIDYANEYKGGLDGHKIVLATCANATLTAATSQNCANQLLTKKPFLILGAADTGAAGAFPIWEAHHLVYIGGSPFTPVESNAPNSAIFAGFSGPDNIAAMQYASKDLKAKSVAIIEADDTQGLSVGKAIAAAAKADGMAVTAVPLSDTATASDFSAAAAQAEAGNPSVIYDETPSDCPQVILAVKQTGYSGKIGGIGPCTSPPAIKAMGSAGNGLFTPSPFIDFDQVKTKKYGAEIKLTEAIISKWAPKSIALDSNALAPFGAIMNLEAILPTIKGKVTGASILKAFETGSNHSNWLGYPYTCNRKNAAGKSICEAYNVMEKVENGNLVTLSGWINGASS
jgi:branched-chain amino acid transport system substrate-binding protein